MRTYNTSFWCFKLSKNFQMSLFGAWCDVYNLPRGFGGFLMQITMWEMSVFVLFNFSKKIAGYQMFYSHHSTQGNPNMQSEKKNLDLIWFYRKNVIFKVYQHKKL